MQISTWGRQSRSPLIKPGHDHRNNGKTEGIKMKWESDKHEKEGKEKGKMNKWDEKRKEVMAFGRVLVWS